MELQENLGLNRSTTSSLQLCFGKKFLTKKSPQPKKTSVQLIWIFSPKYCWESMYSVLTNGDSQHILVNHCYAITIIIISSSSSSMSPASTDLPDPLSPPVSIIHRSREVFKVISFIGTESLYIGSSWSSCLCSSTWRGPQEYVTYELCNNSELYSSKPR